MKWFRKIQEVISAQFSRQRIGNFRRGLVFAQSIINAEGWDEGIESLYEYVDISKTFGDFNDFDRGILSFARARGKKSTVELINEFKQDYIL